MNERKEKKLIIKKMLMIFFASFILKNTAFCHILVFL